MRCYYAHCLALYDTPQERRDVELLTALGFEVDNPNQPTIQKRCDEWKRRGRDGNQLLTGIFKPRVRRAGVVAFRALPDGSIPAGVAKELEFARAAGVPVIELPSAVRRRTLSLDATREYLKEVGQR